MDARANRNNCINPSDSQHNRLYTEDGSAPCLRAVEGIGQVPKIIVTEILNQAPNGCLAFGAHTSASNGQDAYNNRLIIEKQTFAIEGNGSRQSHHGKGYRENVMYTLNTVEQHAVCCFEPGAASRVGGHVYKDGVAPTLRAIAGDNQPCVISCETFHCQTHEEIAPTLKARDYKDPHIVCYALDQQGGKGNCAYSENVSPTLCSDSHGTPHAVCHPISINNNPSACDYHDNGTVVQTLLARMGTGGNQVPLVVEPVPITLQIRSGKAGGGKGALWQTNQSATLSCKNMQTLFQPVAFGVDSYNMNITGSKTCTLTNGGACQHNGPRVMQEVSADD